ncbi:MAG: type VII secretion protein EssC [Oliverpabstia sp.]
MEKRHKLIIYNRLMYKEIDLLAECKQISIGTDYDNEIRLKKDWFFYDFSFQLMNQDGQWEIYCRNGSYIDLGDIRRLLTMPLSHGDVFSLNHQDSDYELLRVAFQIDFDYEDKKYNCILQIPVGFRFTIGGISNCNIYLNSPLIPGDIISLQKQRDGLWLTPDMATYGVYVDGNRIESTVLIRAHSFFSVANYYFYYDGDNLYTDLNQTMRINGINYHIDLSERKMVYPKFNRNTRIHSIIPETPVQILDPPQKPEKPKNNLLMSLIPTVIMLVLMIAIRGVIGSGGVFVIFSTCTMIMGIVTSVITYCQGKKEYNQKIEQRDISYREYINQKRADLTRFRAREHDLLEHIYTDLNHNLKKIEDFSGDLFDRIPEDEDFLCVRIGSGMIEAQRKVQYKNQERFVSDDELTYLPQWTEEEFHYLQNSPVVVPLRMSNVVGVIGEQNDRHAMAKNMILDLVTRHYYDDVKLAFVMDEKQKKEFEWIRFLPHVQSEGSMVRNIACDTDSRTSLFEELYKEFVYRLAHQKDGQFAHLVVMVLDANKIMGHPLSKFICHASAIHVTFVFFEKNKENLPLGCSYIIQVSHSKGMLVDTQDENKITDFHYGRVSNEAAERAANKLAPVFCEAVNLEGSLVKSITLFDLLQIYSVEDLNLEKRWASTQVHRSMAVPLGVKTKNEVVYLDIHEKAHGPHGLVAGTTGSGKSEILQSYILSMATLFHPYEVGFLIIDFKGGGMANQFQNLPHLLGAITNIDGKQIERSLLSIKAELLKRQNYFAEAEVNHIDKYIMKYKNHEVTKPLPHLIIIVDEFAELRAEFPEFMKELVSAARIGRSLGVHLILATQKPSGQVSEQIWSNSRFKLCLKVQSPEDSNEMIKSPLAAEIIEPGRAYFQVGNNEIFELFQSGYSGAPEKTAQDALAAREYSISRVSFSGKREVIFSQKKKQDDTNVHTQLETLVNYVNGYCVQSGINRLSSICLPPLPQMIEYPEQISTKKGTDIIADIGILDDPNHQYQGVTSVNLTTENTIIIGSSQYGKTNLLQTIIRGLAASYTPEEINLYILDFGSMVLKNFEKLNHMGGAVCPQEDEKFKNLFKLLHEEIHTRREKLAVAGVSSFSAYREAGKTDLPQIVLIVDNFTAVKEFYLQEEDIFLPLCREGLAVGISVIIANQQTAGFGYRYLANFAKRIVLYCNESSEYANVIDKCRIEPDHVPGRALTEVEREVFEIQTYRSFKGEKEIDRVDQMRAFVAKCNHKYPDFHAKKIPEIPSLLTKEILERDFGVSGKNSYQVPVALTYENISVMQLSLLQQGSFAIVGKVGSGKKNLLKVILEQMYQNMFTCPAEVYLVDTVEHELQELSNYGFVREYTIDGADLQEYVDQIYEELSERLERVSSGDAVLAEEALKLVIVKGQEALLALNKNTAVMKKYKDLTGRLKNMKVCFIFTDIENAAISYSAPEILKNIKDNKNFFFLEDLQNLKICDISGATLRKFKKKIGQGDGYWLAGNDIEKIKLVKSGR